MNTRVLVKMQTGHPEHGTRVRVIRAHYDADLLLSHVEWLGRDGRWHRIDNEGELYPDACYLPHEVSKYVDPLTLLRGDLCVL